tara:strand:+ start:185 stop:550 length:366 start_codon:yes stop_codon:yes gene_type:complete
MSLPRDKKYFFDGLKIRLKVNSKVNYIAVFNEDTGFKLENRENEIYKSPSEFALKCYRKSETTKKSVNGWKVCEFFNLDSEKWEKLDKLRKMPKEEYQKIIEINNDNKLFDSYDNIEEDFE